MLTREYLLTSPFEGPCYLGFLAEGHAAAGRDAGGWKGLVFTLEIHLGIPSLSSSPVLRAASAEGLLHDYLGKHPDAFYAASFVEDPLGVSRRLLLWRQALLLGGWDGDPSRLPPRLRTAMEALRGFPESASLQDLVDSMAAIVAELESKPRKVLDSLYLIRPREKEPPLARRIIAALEKSGTAVSMWPMPNPPPQKGDLRAARSKLETGGAFTPAGDGFLLRVMGKSPYETAEAVAAWLCRTGAARVLLIADNALRVEIDGALRRYHLPAIGSSLQSPYRGALQILPLTFALRWEPLNPFRLLEFLQLPVSPVPPRVSWKLARVVAECPGIGGNKWNECLAECVNAMEKEKNGSGAGAGRAWERILEWLPSPSGLYAAGAKMPLSEIQRICESLAKWASARARAADKRGLETGRPSEAEDLRAAAGQAGTLSALVRETGLSEIPLLQLMKLVEQATGTGSEVQISVAETGGAYTVSSPAAVLAPADTVVWWNFTETGAEPMPKPLFTAAEARAVNAAGIETVSPEEIALERSDGWKRPFKYASRRLILASHEAELGEDVGVHPVWDELVTGWKLGDIERITCTPSALLGDQPKLEVATAALPSLLLPAGKRVWELRNLSPSLREKESPSSFETIVQCQLAYVLGRQARLHPMSAVSLLKEAILKGQLAHRLFEEIFRPGARVAREEEVDRCAGDAFDRIVREEGAVFLLPGREADLDVLRGSVIRAAKIFGRHLSRYGLSVCMSEEPVSRRNELCLLEGRPDLVLIDKQMRKLIVEMKFSERGASGYRDKLKEGTAFQLAAYRHLIGEGTPIAYLSLRDGQFLTSPDGGFPGALQVEGRTIDETWAWMLDRVRTMVTEHLAKGRVVASGIEDPESPAKPDEKKAAERFCKYCDYRVVCGASWTA